MSFALTKSPAALPGSCYFCSCAPRQGNPERTVLVDTECQVEFHGAVYVCDVCVLQMAHLLGLMAQPEAEQLRQQILDTEIVSEQRRETIEAMQETLSGYQRMVSLVDSRVSVSGDATITDSTLQRADSEANGTSPEPTPELEQQPPSPVGQLEAGEDGTPEPADDEELDGVRSGTSREFTLGI